MGWRTEKYVASGWERSLVRKEVRGRLSSFCMVTLRWVVPPYDDERIGYVRKDGERRIPKSATMMSEFEKVQ
jgi:hypothetical protein